MFNCQLCTRTIGPRISPAVVVTKKRMLKKGWEIVEEINVCPACSESMESAKVANGKKKGGT